MTDERRYSEQEFHQRLTARKERIDAAVATGLLNHEASRAAFLAARVTVLDDGRIAIRRDDFNTVLSELGRVTSHAYLEEVLRAVFDETTG